MSLPALPQDTRPDVHPDPRPGSRLDPRLNPRLDPAALTPPVPWEFRRFLADATTDGTDGARVPTDGVQPVGRPGKVGVLDLTVGADAASPVRKTGVTSRFVKAPMQFTRPLYIDNGGQGDPATPGDPGTSGDPGEAFIYVRSTGGGLAQNDRIRQRIRLTAGARATVTTPAGTPVHRMNAGCATQWISLDVGEEAVCEYLPGQNTLFAGSRLLQVTEVSLADSATLLTADVILTGRLARGERDLFDALGQCWRVERAGRPLLSDTLCVIGAGQGRSEMLLSRWPVWGTVLIVPPVGWGGAAVKELLVEVRALLAGLVAEAGRAGSGSAPVGTVVPGLTAAASTMVGDAGITVRAAGEDPVAVRAVVDAAYDLARRRVLGRPAVDLRRM
ncbi:urease accessory protein UreD [uncultured Corynebacterium sp.]|uniref:urease accessory protein UreD n=1 Tax=uncultured Corynebacterium sp. TaxID=159447 RepID=UPI0025D6F37D|nr:urease accessory protein UreD [uncultured Corynebacterium sp.]